MFKKAPRYRKVMLKTLKLNICDSVRIHGVFLNGTNGCLKKLLVIPQLCYKH